MRKRKDHRDSSAAAAGCAHNVIYIDAGPDEFAQAYVGEVVIADARTEGDRGTEQGQIVRED